MSIRAVKTTGFRFNGIAFMEAHSASGCTYLHANTMCLSISEEWFEVMRPAAGCSAAFSLRTAQTEHANA
jgi:hypothetical protein